MDSNERYLQLCESRYSKMKEIAKSDYLENVMRDIGLDDRHKRFARLARCVRIATEKADANMHMTATALYEAVGEETGEAPRWVSRQITLLIQDAYNSGALFKLNSYSDTEIIRAHEPVGNLTVIYGLQRALLCRAIRELGVEENSSLTRDHTVFGL